MTQETTPPTKPRPRIGRPRKVDRPGGTAQTRKGLIEAAAKIFALRGYERGTVSEIASEAGLTAGAIYRHFPSKADLLLAVVRTESGVSPGLDGLSRREMVSPRHFADLVCRYARSELRELRRLAVEVHAAASRDEDAGRSLLDYSTRVRAALAARLAECAKRWNVDSGRDPEHVASLLLVVLMGLSNLETLDPERIDDEAWVAFLGDAVERMIAGSPA